MTRRIGPGLAWHLAVPLLAAGMFFLQGPRGLLTAMGKRLLAGEAGQEGFWLLGWLHHALASAGLSPWDPPVFHPLGGALALGEPMFGSLLLYSPVRALGGGPVLAANITALGGAVLGAYFVFLLVRMVGGSRLAGLAAGLLFAGNPLHWWLVAGLRQGAFIWAVLALYLLERWLAGGRARLIWAAAAAGVVQAYTSITPSAGLAAVAAVVLLHRATLGGGLAMTVGRRGGLHLAGALTLGAAALAPLLVWSTGAAARPMGQGGLVSGGLTALALPPATLGAQGGPLAPAHGMLLRGLGGAEGGVFPGIVLLGLTTILIITLALRRIRRTGRILTGAPARYLAAALVAAALACGSPRAFGPGLLLALAVCAGLAVVALARLQSRGAPALKLVLATALLAAGVWEYRLTEWQGALLDPASPGAAEYRYLQKSRRSGPLLELPAGPPMAGRHLAHQAMHWRPKLGGPSGWRPARLMALLEATEACPDPACLRYLASGPARTVLIHLDRLPIEQQLAWREAEAEEAGFTAMGVVGDALIWERRKKPTPPENMAPGEVKKPVEVFAPINRTEALMRQEPPPLPPDLVGEEFKNSELEAMDVDPGEAPKAAPDVQPGKAPEADPDTDKNPEK